MTTCTRRVSLFERYDEDLEMVVLSGNDSMREEIELSEICLDMEEEEEFQMPEWAGAEVTGDRRYANSRLAQEPYCNWQEK